MEDDPGRNTLQGQTSTPSMNRKSEALIKGAMQPRAKKIQFLSISPLDRLLNQRGFRDEVRIQVSCNASESGTTTGSKYYDV
jgi:hypothetical protein